MLVSAAQYALLSMLRPAWFLPQYFTGWITLTRCTGTARKSDIIEICWKHHTKIPIPVKKVIVKRIELAVRDVLEAAPQCPV